MQKPALHTALIDADVLVYRVGFSAEGLDEGIAIARLDETYGRILEATGAEKTRCFLTSTDKSNFRFGLYPLYKANRTQPKPQHYQLMRDTLVNQYQAIVVGGEEADDALGKHQEEGSVIVSNDKDLDMIPGWHYNFVTDWMYNISPLEGYRWFYMQCLEGDRSDNIPGVPKIGKVKALRMLEGCENEEEMFKTVLEKYLGAFGEEDGPGQLWLVANLLWIRRKGMESWHLNGSPVSRETLLQYSQSMA